MADTPAAPENHYLAVLNHDGTARSLFRSDHPLDPRPEGAIDITEAQWQEWRGNLLTRKWANGALQAYEPPPPPPQPYSVSKLLIVARLTAVGKLRAAYTALKLEAPMSELSDDELALRETWLAATEVVNTDQRARLLLQAIGADVDAILAPPET